ncbi:MAG: ABC transporter ATP-binding protein [Candidatus Kariarchaeaceae archaeon]|jgi:putative ABC transport system ATP-binding protein
MTEIIGTKDLRMVYGNEDLRVEALRGIDLSIEQGELTSLVGPSGSGKSTLLHLIGAMMTPTSGEINILGQSIQSFNRLQLARVRRENIGFIFQNFALVPHLSALENVMLPLYPINPPNLEERATLLLEKVGLEQRLDHNPSQLSGGERQRVAVARALINDPSLVLGDEITGNLDSTTGKDIFDLIESLNKEGMTILLVTHDMSVADSCRRKISMQDGRLLLD